MDYLRNLHLQKDFQMVKLAESLSQLENEIIKEANSREFNTETQILKDLFTIASEEKYKMPKDRWDIVRFNIYIFIVAHTPKNHIIPDLSHVAQTNYGPLFFIVTILSNMNSEKQQPDLVKECFLKVKDNIIFKEQKSPYEFYVLSTASYTFLLPSLVNKLFKENALNFFVDFFNSLKSRNDEAEKQINPSSTIPNPKELSAHRIQLSLHTHQFFLELLKIMQNHKDEFIDSSKVIIHTLWFSFKASSTLLPLYFNFINLILKSDKQIRGPPPIDKDQVTLMLSENVRFRHNDIFKTMVPSHIFDFFNKATSIDLIKSRRTLRFICQFLFTDNQRELFRKMRTVVKDNTNPANPNREDNLIYTFINNQIQQYNKGHARFPLLFLLEQLSASFGFLTGIIRQIKAVRIGPADKNYLYFSEQVIDKSDLTDLDEVLYSKYEYVSYDNKEEAFKAYEKNYKYVDLFQERYILPFSFFQKLMDLNEPFQIHGHDTRNSNGMRIDGSNSSLYFNVKQLFTSFFKLIIEIGYRYMLISQFLHTDACLSPQIASFFNKRNLFDIGEIFNKPELTVKAIVRKISEIFNKPELTDQTLQPYAKIIADLLFEAVKERHVTSYLVSYLYIFNSPNPRDMNDSRLYQMVVNQMISFVYTNTDYIDSLDIEESNNFHQYLLLALNLGRKLRSGLPQFLILLSQYQKSFMTILLNRFRCTNQREFLNTMIQYTRILNDNATEQLRKTLFEQTMEDMTKKRPLIQAPLLRYAMTDYRKELKNLSTYLILDRYVIDNTKPNIKHLILLYLTSAYQSLDPSLISKALNQSLPSLLNPTKPDIIKDNQQLLFDNDSDSCRAFYTSLFKSLLNASREDSQKIIDSIPQLLLLFNSWKTNISSRQIGFIIPRYNVDLMNILNSILTHFNGKESEAVHILLFLNTLINDESFNENIDKMPIQVIDQLILNLTGLFGYKIIRQHVINLFKVLHKKFLPVVIEGNYNYLLSLFFNVQYSYSEGNSLYVKIIEMFFNMATVPDSPTFNGSRIINSYFAQNRTMFNFNELLVFFTIIQRKWPGCITDEHFHLYLLSLTINSPTMIQHTKPELYTKPFNNFLKEYIANLKQEQIRPFLSTVIRLIESNKLLFIFKRVFFKRLSKAHFPSPFKSYNHISLQQEKESFYLLLYLTLLFGVQSNEPIPEPIFRRSIDEIKKICNREVNFVSSLLFVLIYFIKIIFITQPDNSRYFGEDVLKSFLTILNMASFKLSPVDDFRKQIKKCIQLMKERAPSSYEKFAKDLINASLSLNSMSAQNHFQSLKNIARQAYLFPECIQKEHFQAIFNHINDFSNFSNENKIKALNQMIKFIGFLSFPDYKSQKSAGLKQFLMSEFKDPKEMHLSYFAYLVHLFVVITNDSFYPSSYSFIDSVQAFLNNFKKETIDVIISHPFINEIEQSYDLLFELTMLDKTDEFFKLIIEKFSELSREEKMQNLPNSTSSTGSLSQNHISSQHPAFFNVLNRLAKTERFSNYPNFGDLILSYFHSVMTDRSSTDNKTTAMNILIDTAIEAIKTSQTRKQIIFITNYIATSGVNTPLYRKWKELVFKNRERSFYVNYFIDFLQNYKEIRPYEALEIILVQLLKGLKSLRKEENIEIEGTTNENENNNEEEIDLDDLFLSTMRKLILEPELLTCAMGCFVVYFKFNKADSHNLPIALSAFGPALMQPNPYCIIHVFKLTNILLGETNYNNSFNNSNTDNNNNENMDDKNENKDEEEESNTNDKLNYKNETNIDEELIELLLPILSDIIQHILYFQKFLDPPYIQYTSTLLRKANKLFNKNNIPDKLSDCFKQFVINKIIRFKEMDKIITVIQLMPVLIEIIPFSLVYSAFHNIDLCAHHMRNNAFRPEDNFTVIFFAIKYSLKLKLSEDEESYIFKYSFNFLREIFKGEEVRMKTISDYFLRPLMSKAKYMPPDLLEIAIKKFMQDPKIIPAMRSFYVSFAILSTEAVDAQILLRNIDFIMKAFEECIKKFNQFYRVYVQSIFNRPELATTKLVDHFFNILQNQLVNIDTRFLLLHTYITTSKHPDKFKYLSFFWEKELQLIHYQRLASFIEYLPIEQQSAYLHLILEKTKESRNALFPVFINSFINSKEIAIKVKIEFLQEIPFMINDFDYVFIDKLNEAIQDLEFDTFEYQLLLLFYSIVKADDSTRLLHYQKLRKLIGNTEEERFITLTKVIPSFLWSNQNLPFISLVIIGSENEDILNGSSKLDLPLIMLSEMFDSFSSDFMSSILVRIINERTLNTIHGLLTDCLSQHINQQEQFHDLDPQQQQQPQHHQHKQNNKNHAKKQIDNKLNNCNQIITAIVKSLHETQIPIQPRLLYKTLKISNDFSLFSCNDKDFYSIDENDYFDDDSNPASQSNIIPDKLLLPHKVNDVIFGSVTDGISYESLAASAQFFLGNYEESEKIYRRAPYPENKIVRRLQQLSSDIVMKINLNSLQESQNQQSFHKFALFDRYKLNDFLLLPSLEQAYSPDRSNVIEEHEDSYKLKQLSRADQCNILYFRHHPHLSHYERQRISALQCIIMLMQTKLKGKRQIVNSASVSNSIPQPTTNSVSVSPSSVTPNLSITPPTTPAIGNASGQISVQMNAPTPLTPPMISPISPQQGPPAPMIQQVQMQQGPVIDMQMQFRNNQMPRPLPVQMTPQGQPPPPPQQQQQQQQNQQQMQMMRQQQGQQQQQFIRQQQQQQQQQLQPQQQKLLMHHGRGFNSDSFNFKLLPCMNYIVESCLPPPVSKFVIDFSKEMTSNDLNKRHGMKNSNSSLKTLSRKQSPFIVFSSEFRHFFNDLDWKSETIIKPADFHGFFAVSSNSLFEKFNQYLNKTPSKQNQLDLTQQEYQQMSSFDPFLWPSFCFNIFASSEKSSEVLFKIALESYLRLITEEKPLNASIQASSSSSSMTAAAAAAAAGISHSSSSTSVNPNANLNNPSNSASNSSSSSNNSSGIVSPIVTMPPFLCLASSARVMNLFGYAISNQVENPPIFNSALKCCDLIIPEKTTPYLKTWMPQMVSLRSDFPPVFREKTECLSMTFGHIATILAHKMTIKPEQKKMATQLECLSKLCDFVMGISDDAFESARRRKKYYSKSSITATTSMNGCEDFVTMEDLEPIDLSEEDKRIHKRFFELLYQLNQHMPFEYDRRSPFLLKVSIKIIHFHANFAKLSNKAVTFTCATLGPPRQRFIVERVENTDQAVTFSNVLEGIKNVFKYGYASRQRRIRLSSHPAMELGQHFVMRLFPLEIVRAGRIRDENESENKEFEDDDDNESRLLNKMVATYSQKDFFKMRRAIIASFAAYSVIRNMFSLNQPNQETLFISLLSAEFPFIINDFVIPDQFGQTASLITDEMQKLFGQSGPGEVAMAISAASDALARRIDAVRSLVEVPVVGIFDTREKNFETVLAKRDWIDFMILSLAPPIITKKMQSINLENTEEEDDDNDNESIDDKFVDASVDWISNVQNFVNNSMKKFDIVLFENDFIQSNKINNNINNDEGFDLNSEQSSEAVLNPLDLNNPGEIIDTNSRNSSSINVSDNSTNNFNFLFQQNDDDDAFSGFMESKDDQTDDFDF